MTFALWPFLAVALCAYLGGMLGSAAYALFVFRSLPRKDSSGAEVFLFILVFQLVKSMQLPKIGIALAAAWVAFTVCSTVPGAIGLAALICFSVAGLFLSFVMHRGGNE